jgi:hypothetical protein
MQATLADFVDSGRHCARRVLDVCLHIVIAIKCLVTGRIGSVVADKAVEARHRTKLNETHPVEPVAQCASGILDTRDVAVNDNAICAASEMLGIVPSCEFDLFGLFRILAVCSAWIGVASVSADQRVNHQLQRTQ